MEEVARLASDPTLEYIGKGATVKRVSLPKLLSQLSPPSHFYFFEFDNDLYFLSLGLAPRQYKGDED
jgi:hypothetical protein